MLPNPLPSPGSTLGTLIFGQARWEDTCWQEGPGLGRPLLSYPLIFCGSLVPRASHQASDLLTRGQRAVSSSCPVTDCSSPLPGPSIRHRPVLFWLLCPPSASFPVLLPLSYYASAVLTSNQTCSTSGPLH